MNSNCYMNRTNYDLQIKIKKLVSNAIIPFYGMCGDAGLDLVATSINENDMYIEYCTGLAIEIPKKYVCFIFPRSSISKYTLMLKNSIGVIDSGYRGEIKCRFQKLNFMYNQYINKSFYNIGDKIAQLIIMPYPSIELIETEELSDSNRGEGGFGSTGK